MTAPLPQDAELVPALPWVERLEESLFGVRWRDGVEDLHGLRVSTRRLVCWLDLAGMRVLRDDLQRLRRSVSARRDLDVLLAGELPEELERWARERREGARAELLGAVTAPFVPALVSALHLLPPTPRALAAPRLARMARRALRRASALEEAAPSMEALHRLRRALRPVRYGLDWLGQSQLELQALQEALGLVHDAWVGEGVLASWGGAAPELSARLQNDRETALESARLMWPAARERLRALARGEPLPSVIVPPSPE